MSVLIAPHVAVLQVMNSDAALYSVTIPETRSSKSHFCHRCCILLSLIFLFERHVTVGYFT